MKTELRGGPNDGEMRELPEDFIIMRDDELYITDQNTKPMLIACYRWLFGEADHLDFAGYDKVPE
jgi:hypothetical protein